MILYDSSNSAVTTSPVTVIETFPIDIGVEPLTGNSVNLNGGSLVVNLHRVVKTGGPQGSTNFTQTPGPAIPSLKFDATSVTDANLSRKIDRAGGSYGISVSYVGGTLSGANFSVRVI